MLALENKGVLWKLNGGPCSLRPVLVWLYTCTYLHIQPRVQRIVQLEQSSAQRGIR